MPVCVSVLQALPYRWLLLFSGARHSLFCCVSGGIWHLSSSSLTHNVLLQISLQTRSNWSLGTWGCIQVERGKGTIGLTNGFEVSGIQGSWGGIQGSWGSILFPLLIILCALSKCCYCVQLFPHKQAFLLCFFYFWKETISLFTGCHGNQLKFGEDNSTVD